MHSSDKIHDFIERRSKGESFDLIASEIGVARSTLFEWNKKYRSKILRSAHDDNTDCQRFDIDDLQTSKSFAESLQNRLGINIKSCVNDIRDLPLDRQISLWFKVQREIDRMTLRQRKQKAELFKHLDQFPEDTTPDQFLDDALSPSRAVEPGPDISPSELAEMFRKAHAQVSQNATPPSTSPKSPKSPIMSASVASTQPCVENAKSGGNEKSTVPVQVAPFPQQRAAAIMSANAAPQTGHVQSLRLKETR